MAPKKRPTSTSLSPPLPPAHKRLTKTNVEFDEDNVDDVNDVVVGSGVRHTRSRCVNASAQLNSSPPQSSHGSKVCHDYDVDSEGNEDEGSEGDEDEGSEGNEDEGSGGNEDEGSKGDEEPVIPPRVVVRDSNAPITIHRRKGKFIRNPEGSMSTTGRCRRDKGTRDTWLVTGLMGGGPSDGSVIPSYPAHVARSLWEATSDRGKLHCQSRVVVCKRLMKWYRGIKEDLRDKLGESSLSHLPFMMASHIDTPLISAFVERWQPDTNTFHLPFGEMTIMLHDVQAILEIPVEGSVVSCTYDDTRRSLMSLILELLQVSDEATLKAGKAPIWQRGCVKTSTIIGNLEGLARDPDCEMTGWLLTAIGCCLFTDKSRSRVRSQILRNLDHLDRVPSYSWGSACLAFLYRQLGMATRSESRGIGGYLTLLQAWIYEHFPCFRPRSVRKDIGHSDPRALRWVYAPESKDRTRLASFRARLDKLTPEQVLWTPFGANPAAPCPGTTYIGPICYRDIGEMYNPDRVTRQLGYVQRIPQEVIFFGKAYRPPNSRKYEVEFHDLTHIDKLWKRFAADGYAASLILASLTPVPDGVPYLCEDDYDTWFMGHSHPYICPAFAAFPPTVVVPGRSHTEYWIGRYNQVVHGLIEAHNDPHHPMVIAAQKLLDDWNFILHSQ
ncbi:protein MAIN-LIKE 1-like [Spinacia oleracea]|uniref:Protein MAIN-LIKE 1-like n=1 Tax=Spinacia oleracea TaxID=3562 RepID=A0ABM3RHK2_SPIOL|nr:protein MAIN-LIKE 1-like [Spinacia oleracea]